MIPLNLSNFNRLDQAKAHKCTLDNLNENDYHLKHDLRSFMAMHIEDVNFRSLA